jgi:hypothetical protein
MPQRLARVGHVAIYTTSLASIMHLTNKNASLLRKTLAPYIAAGRTVKNSRGVSMKRTQVGADNRTIKEWARANGYEMNDRGRIPNHIREAFDEAN